MNIKDFFFFSFLIQINFSSFELLPYFIADIFSYLYANPMYSIPCLLLAQGIHSLYNADNSDSARFKMQHRQ